MYEGDDAGVVRAIGLPLDTVGGPTDCFDVEIAGRLSDAAPGDLLVLGAVGLAYALFDFGVSDVGVVVAGGLLPGRLL